MRHCSKHICRVGRRPLNTVAVINSSLACFGVHVKVLQIIVKVSRSRTQVPPKQCCVGGEDGCDINSPFSAKRQGHTSQPLVTMANHCTLAINVDQLAQEPGHNVTQENSFVGFMVMIRSWNASNVPQVSFPFIEHVVSRMNIEKQNTGGTFNQPSSVQPLDTTFAHGI